MDQLKRLYNYEVSPLMTSQRSPSQKRVTQNSQLMPLTKLIKKEYAQLFGPTFLDTIVKSADDTAKLNSLGRAVQGL